MKNIARLLICIALFCADGVAQGAGSTQEFSAKVIAVLDGDTVLVLRGHHKIKVRLAEIDAPEKAQVFGEASKRSLSGIVLGKQVKVASQAVDKYGRIVAHLSLDGLDVNAEQIRRGMAWEYSSYHSNQRLVALEAEARQVPRGLWALSDPLPPWEWRKAHPNVAGNPSHAALPAGSAAVQENTLGFTCGSKKHCSEMASCEEARHYLTQCGIKTLDRNGDGVPCESLCAGKK